MTTSEPQAAAIQEIRDWLATQQIQDPPKGSHASRIAALLAAYDKATGALAETRQALAEVEQVWARRDLAVWEARERRLAAAERQLTQLHEAAERLVDMWQQSPATRAAVDGRYGPLSWAIDHVAQALTASPVRNLPDAATAPEPRDHYPVITHGPDEPLPAELEWSEDKEDDWTARKADDFPRSAYIPEQWAPGFLSPRAAEFVSGYQATKSQIEADR